jgi:hypothetical protein
MSPARNVSLVAALALTACMRTPDPAASAARAPANGVSPSAHAAVHERKPSAGARVEITVAPTQSDTAAVTVTITATRALRGAVLRIGTELPARVEGEAQWPLDPMSEGATITRLVTVRRNQAQPHGSLVTATVSVEQPGQLVTDVGSAWAFGTPDPARVLPQSSEALGEQGIGVLGPNDRVVRTPEGERVHESLVQ